MTFQQIIYLVEVSKCNSLNKAAENLFVSQSAISIAIRSLEEELGAKLFVRNNRGVKFAPEGLQFVTYASQLLEQKQWLEGLFRNTLPQEQLQRLSVSSMRFSCFLKAFAQQIQRSGDHRFSYTYRMGTIEEVIRDVFDRQADVGIISVSELTERSVTYLLKSKGLVFHELTTLSSCALCRVGHPLCAYESVTEADVRKFPYIYFDPNVNNAMGFSEEIQFKAPNSFPQTVCVNSGSVSANLVELTDSVVLGAGLFIPELWQNTVAIPLQDMPSLQMGYIIPRGAPVSPILEDYIRQLQQSVKETVEEIAARREAIRKKMQGQAQCP